MPRPSIILFGSKNKGPQFGYCGPLILVSEPCSALSTSACQNLTTILGCHSLEESMLFLSVNLLRLIRSLDLHF